MVIHMFYNYKIIDNVLYLYVDDKCEIGNFYSRGKQTLLDKIKHYINDMKINFNGTKVVLLLSGLMLGTIYLNNNSYQKSYDVYKDNKYVYNIVHTTYPTIDKKVEDKIDETLKDIKTSSDNQTGVNKIVENKTIYSSEIKKDTDNITEPIQKGANDSYTGIKVTINRANKDVINLSLEDYLIGVVAAEMPASFDEEALKAQAVVARTYTMKLINSGRTITDDVSTQVYKSDDELKMMWGAEYNKYYNKIKNAVIKTDKLCIFYKGNLIDAVYHSTSNGYTEDASMVWGNSIPYLKVVTSPWDTSTSNFFRSVDISFTELSSKLGYDFNSETIIEIISRDESGRVLNIKIGDKKYAGVQLRNLIGLRSADFDVIKNPYSITFVTRGYGHGVGMSQYGANGMAKSGYTYEQILKYYYSGVDIVSTW